MWKNCKNLFSHHKKILSISVCAGLMLVLVKVELHRYLGIYLDRLLYGTGGYVDFLLMGLVGFALCAALSRVKAYGVQLLQYRLRNTIYSNVYSQLIYRENADVSLGELTSILSHDVTVLIQAVSRFVTKTVYDLSSFLFASFAFMLIDPAISAIAIVVSILPTLMIRVLSRQEALDQREFMKEMENVNQTASVGLYSIASVKANAMEDVFCIRYKSALERLYRRRKKLEKTVTTLYVPSIACAFGVQIVIVFFGGWFAAKGRITTGEMATLVTLMPYVVDPVMCFENTIVAFHSFKVSLKRMEGYLTCKAIEESTNRAAVTEEIVLKDVSFSYTGEKDVLHHLSLSLSKGKTHILRGANGAGKSTLIRLLCGALHPQKGKIFILGQDSAGLGKQEYEELVSVMPQEAILLDGTIMENLRLGQPGASKEQVVEICKRCGIHDEIMMFPDGYDTHLTENGGVLSGGQKQRISFARTVLRDTPVMIFDEPSSALDDVCCTKMLRVLTEMSKEKIVLVITHDARLIEEDDHVMTMGREE